MTDEISDNGHESTNGHTSSNGEAPESRNGDLPFAPGTEAYRSDPGHYGIYPGEEWPEDVPRDQDDMHWRFEGDPKGARKAELKIASLWIITLLCGLGLAVDYEIEGRFTAQIQGSLLAIGFIALGTGMVLWARDLLPGQDVTASRGPHHAVSSEESRGTVVQSLGRAVEPMARRPFLLKVLLGVGGIFGLGVLFPLASLGPRPHTTLDSAGWGNGTRLVDEDGRPIKPADIMPKGILTVFPQSNLPLDDPQLAMSSSLLINLADKSEIFKIRTKEKDWTIDVPDPYYPSVENKLVCFSKICTHAGCPVSLYNTQANQLVCPCHQSTFDVLSDCKPVFGPAPRSLPQMALATDSEGYLISQFDYTQPVGPGFWNRG